MPEDLLAATQAQMADLATSIGTLGIAVLGVTVAYIAIRWAVRLFKGA